MRRGKYCYTWSSDEGARAGVLLQEGVLALSQEGRHGGHTGEEGGAQGTESAKAQRPGSRCVEEPRPAGTERGCLPVTMKSPCACRVSRARMEVGSRDGSWVWGRHPPLGRTQGTDLRSGVQSVGLGGRALGTTPGSWAERQGGGASPPASAARVWGAALLHLAEQRPGCSQGQWQGWTESTSERDVGGEAAEAYGCAGCAVEGEGTGAPEDSNAQKGQGCRPQSSAVAIPHLLLSCLWLCAQDSQQDPNL